MKTAISNKGFKTLQSFSSWQTVDEKETLIEFEPMGYPDGNFLHINSIHWGVGMKRRRSLFIHVLTRRDVEVLRDFLDEVLGESSVGSVSKLESEVYVQDSKFKV